MGADTLDYCTNISKGFMDFLVRIPSDILRKIIAYLNLEDIINLSYTSKLMHQHCNANGIWKSIYLRHSSTQISETVEELAQLFGWKKVFFTSKLQLQKQIRRLRNEHSSQRGDEDQPTSTHYLEDSEYLPNDVDSTFKEVSFLILIQRIFNESQ
ncbi:hypothetical protein FBUS_05556 [Fasciolopsis buskii]|uniref:F-box domain-containing protein n=1 Tax=Fasciolopsis buskii TaxID=27845 RepID=A0A8E0RRE9_9TREM|nr:hypothetical protein FBUS_05556 [Fasciolopsis buski]